MLGSIQQAQGNLGLGRLSDLLWDPRLLASPGILGPGLGQKQLSADWKVKRGTAGRVIGQELGTHHHLAVANFAQRSGVLWGDADRGAPLLGQAGVVKHQNAITHRMQLQQALHAHFIQLEWVPGSVGEQVLQSLAGGSCDHVSNGVRGLVGQIGEEPGHVALHTVSARVPWEEWGKWLQEGR